MEVCIKPNFKQMPDDQLRDYIKQHRTDDEAIADLFVNRRSSDAEATWYTTAGIKETVDIICQRITKPEESQP